MGGGFLFFYFSTLQGLKVGESFRKNGKFTPTYIGKNTIVPIFLPKKSTSCKYSRDFF